MIENLHFMKFIEHSKCAFIVANFKEASIVYSNTMAKSLYGVTTETLDLEPLFKPHHKGLYEMFLHDMKERGQGVVLIPDVKTITIKNTIQLVDLHLGYFDQENFLVYLEILPKSSDPTEFFQQMINQSTKPTLVLEQDSSLSIRYCSPRTRECYNILENSKFSDCFPEAVKEAICEEILQHFKTQPETPFYKHFQLQVTPEKKVWYALNLEQITLTPEDHPLICNLTCIEEQISMEEELNDVNQYFSILQKLTKGLLYRFDIKNRILYRNEETAQFYGVPASAENYPDPEKLKGVFHKEDISEYVEFIHFVLSGGEGSHYARLFSPSGKYEYHKITFKAVKNPDGSVKEMVGNAVNVQDLKEAQQELSTVNQYFDMLQSFSKDLLYRLDIKNRILYRNENTSAYYGIPPVVEDYPNFENLKGVFHPDDIDHYVKFIEKVLQGEEGTHTARLISPSGNFEFHKFTFRKPPHQKDEAEEMIGHAVNIHSLMELEKKASYDMLTNCLNKISFQEQVVHILKNSAIGHRHALFFVDLDDFKGINDNLGHTFGDFLLKTVGTRLKKLVRDNDVVGRVGGDEFVIFLEECGDDMDLKKRGIQILDTLREEYLQNSTTAHINGSVGIAIYPHHGTSYDALYDNADKALYHSKHLGKNLATIYYKGLGE